MNKRFLLNPIAQLVALLLLASCGEDKKSPTEELPDTLFQGEYNETEMDSAMAEARKTLSHFREALESGTGKSHAVKVAIHDGEDTEHFWLTDVSPVGEGFKGTLNNKPGIVSNVSFGDEVNATGKNISDWMYMLDEKMYGNYTLRVMLPNMPADEAEFYKSKLAPLPK